MPHAEMRNVRSPAGRTRMRLLAIVPLMAALAAVAAGGWVSFAHATARPAPSRRVSLAQASPAPSSVARATATPDSEPTTAQSPEIPTARAVARALAWAERRAGQVGVAIVDSHGVLHGYDAHRQFQSASLSKAMLLVADLRLHPHPTSAMRATLTSMIEESDNQSADIVYGIVGNAGLLRVAKLAGMKDFGTGASWISAQVSAADQARFFYAYESYLPHAAVALARELLSGITPVQRWGIPAAAGPAGWKVFFKGGWLGEDNDVMNQAAWLQRHGVRWSLAILTADNPTSSYGWQTQKGITGLLLGHKPTSAYLAVVHEGDAPAS